MAHQAALSGVSVGRIELGLITIALDRYLSQEQDSINPTISHDEMEVLFQTQLRWETLYRSFHALQDRLEEALK